MANRAKIVSRHATMFDIQCGFKELNFANDTEFLIIN